MSSMHPPTHTLMQNMHIVQAWPRAVQCGLAVMKKNHKNTDKETSSINLSIDARDTCADFTECMSTHKIQETTQNEEHCV